MTRKNINPEKIKAPSDTRIHALKTRVLGLIAPVSKNEDQKRRELILNVILLASIIFLTFLDGTVVWNSIRLFPHYHGIPWVLFTLMVAACVCMLVASKRGYASIVSYGIIGLYTAGSLYGGWRWGISLPATLLSFALISVTASILVGSSFGFTMSGFLIVSLGVLSVHEIYSLGVLPWKYETITATDVVTYSAILLFIAILSWLSNREIQKSLDRARISEKSLAEERDLLEIKVVERTEELYRAQAERMEEISRTVEFGRLSQGLFHDLMTPLASVALYMEKLRNLDMPEAHEARAYLTKAISASHKMGNFMSLIKEQIRQTSGKNYRNEMFQKEHLSVAEELYATLELLRYKARNAHVLIDVQADTDVLYQGNGFYLHRIFLNIISNAIEAHENTPDRADRQERKINVVISQKMTQIFISISNNGPVISTENMNRLFDPFFSTKSPDKGIGVGLSTVKNIVENELHGTIVVESSENKTCFTISFPA